MTDKNKKTKPKLTDESELIRIDIPKLKRSLRYSQQEEEILEHSAEPSENSILNHLILLALPSPSQQVH